MQTTIILEITALAAVAALALLLGRYARPIAQWFRAYDTPFDEANLDSIPAVMWIETDQVVTWSNTAFQTLQKSLGKDLRISNFIVSESVENKQNSLRASIKQPKQNPTLYFDISTRVSRKGSFYIAMSANAAVTAENDRARFIQTLSETFAHLPIGMAVFDKERDLSLFNPALASLLDVSALWLAKKPSLRDFLDRLHDKGALPEPRNFKSWRDQIIEMERSAETGTYFDDWHMPNDKVFRVTGRPHPKGAVAFVFEDISRTVAAERAYRMEIERLYAALDAVDGGIIIFDAVGALSFANKSFDSIWNTEFSNSLSCPTAIEVAEVWNERCIPSPVLGEIREFVQSIGDRERWAGRLGTKSGLSLEVRAIPMPANFSMVEFTPICPT